MFSKICYFVNETTFQSVYFAIFNSYLLCACTAWGQSTVSSHRVCILQKNAPCIIYFAKLSNHTTQVFSKMKIIKFVDLITVENRIFINKCFSCKSCSVFSHLYNSARHDHQTRLAMNGPLILPNCNTAKCCAKAFLYSTISSWNSFQTLFSEKKFRIISPISLRKLFKDYGDNPMRLSSSSPQ